MLKNLRIGPRIALGASILLLLSVALLTGGHLWQARSIVFAAEERELANTFEMLRLRIHMQGDMAVMASRLLAEMPDVQRAMARDDRTYLHEQFRPGFLVLEKTLGVRQMQFHTPEAHSLFRVHLPQRFGDDLSDFRHTVVAANREQRSVSGLERGVAGIGIRGVAPVHRGKDLLGSVEMGLSFGQPFFEHFAEDYGVEVALHLPFGDRVQVFGTSFEAAPLLSEPQLQRALSGESVLIESQLGALPVAVYGNRISDYSGRPLGIVEIVKDRTFYAHSLASVTYYGLVIGSALLIIGIGGALLLARGISRPVAVAVEAADRMADGDLSLEVDSSARDETGVLLRAIGHTIRRLRIAVGQSEERARRLEGVNRELEAFAYSVSHDLRAPLRGIHGFSELLLRRYGGCLDEAGTDYLRRVRNATTRMATLIDDLLDLSRVTRTSLALKPVDLSAMALDVVADLRQREPERQVDFRIESGLQVEGDPHLLRIMLINLLQNAWKFTRFNDRPQVEMGSESIGGVRAFVVRDNGAGFDMQFAHKLFGAFERLHHGDQYPGTGVGLATVQRIVHRHDGEIWARGEEGKGATFWFTLGERPPSIPVQIPLDPSERPVGAETAHKPAAL